MKIPSELAKDLIESWELQQNCHIRFRETRFEIMFEVAQHALGNSLNSLDIACGPGSLTRRLIERYPGSRVTSVDFDPVLLSIGKEALSDLSDRIRWVEGDLRKDAWLENLPTGSYDVAMSTTALHWLDEDGLANLYGNIFKLLKNGGMFMNGDHMVKQDGEKHILNILHDANEEWNENAFKKSKAMDWEEWWSSVRGHTEFGELLQERARRYPNPDDHNQMVTLERHIEFLKKAGFRLIDVVWQYSSDRILVAIK